MTLLDSTRAALAAWPEPVPVSGDRIAVRTPVLYPSNMLVTVFVRGGSNEYLVSDGRGALQQADAEHSPHAGKIIGRVAKSFGLMVTEHGEIYSSMVAQDQLAATISLVANSARQSAIELARSIHPPVRRDLKQELKPLLTALFPSSVVHYEGRIAGKSNKSYAFDFVVDLGEERRLLLDAVTPEASSINAAAIAHLDVGQTKNKKFRQAIVYDDTLEWRAADLGVLQLGATPIPIAQAERMLARVAVQP